METLSPAVNPAATASPAAPKPTFEKFEKLDSSPGNVVSEPPKPPVEEPEAKAEPEEKPDTEKKPKEEKAAPKPRYKVKVDGQEQELDLDEILAGYQRAAASTKRSQEAAAQRKEAEALRGQLEQAVQVLQNQSVEQIARALGRSDEELEAFAEATLQKKLARDKMSPVERQTADLQDQLNQLQAQKQQYEDYIREQQETQAQTQEQAQYDAELKAYADKIDQELPAVMDKYGLPRTPITASLVARVMAEQLDAGNDSFTIEDAAALARESITQWMAAVLNEDLPVETLRAIIPEKAVQKIREAAVQKATGNAPVQDKRPAPKKQPKEVITSFSKLYEDDLYSGDASDPITTSLVR
jgi:hypothetical protein